MHPQLKLGPFSRARFVARPNRFLVHCEIDGAGVQEAFLPNPGRLSELLLPNVRLYVADHDSLGAGAGTQRKTRYTVLAVEREGRPIMLHTHLTNAVARHLIQHRLIASLEDAEIVRAEYPVGNSRFDFLLRDGRRQVYLEVKSCTLFGNGVAMFPDAVTQRGRRHLSELASLRSRTVRPCVLFVVHMPDVKWFMPDYHTDLEFSRTLLEVRKRVDIVPVAVGWNRDLSLDSSVREVNIPWDYLRREVDDRGSYLLLLRLDEPKRISVGNLGAHLFSAGYYIYVGSAMHNLQTRLARHERRRKKMHWHIDYLRDVASALVALPIRSSRREECEVARAISEHFAPGPTGFGCSDCTCPVHLFRHETDPLDSLGFHAILQQFRMRHPNH